MRKWILLALLLIPVILYAAMRDLAVAWEYPIETEAGDPLDADGDGDLSEGLTGYNFYRVACTDINHQPPGNLACTTPEDNVREELMLANIEPWDTLAWAGKLNLPFSATGSDGVPTDQHCFILTAYWRGDVEQPDGSFLTVTNESKNSGIVCKPWLRGTPKPPKNHRRTF